MEDDVHVVRLVVHELDVVVAHHPAGACGARQLERVACVPSARARRASGEGRRVGVRHTRSQLGDVQLSPLGGVDGRLGRHGRGRPSSGRCVDRCEGRRRCRKREMDGFARSRYIDNRILRNYCQVGRTEPRCKSPCGCASAICAPIRGAKAAQKVLEDLEPKTQDSPSGGTPAARPSTPRQRDTMYLLAWIQNAGRRTHARTLLAGGSCCSPRGLTLSYTINRPSAPPRRAGWPRRA